MLLLFPVVVLAGLGALAGRIHVDRQEARREADLRDSYRRRIEADPTNLAAYEALADALLRARRPLEARDAYLAALNLAPAHFPTERIRARIEEIDRDRRGERFVPELYFCPSCGGGNVPAARVCEHCERDLPYTAYREALRDPQVLRAAGESAVMMLVLGVALFVFGEMPLDVKGSLVMSAIIVIAWRMLRAIERGRDA